MVGENEPWEGLSERSDLMGIFDADVAWFEKGFVE